MKTIRLLLSALIVLAFNSCSNDLSEEFESPASSENDALSKVIPASSLEFVKNNPELAAELQQVFKATAHINTAKQAMDKGWTVLVDVFFPSMGYHYVNPDYLSNDFVMTEPEAIVVFCDKSGKYKAVAIEYLVAKENYPDGPPEGFTGDWDVWGTSPDGVFWTLHVWFKMVNPDGVFNPTNSNLPAENPCNPPAVPMPE